MWRGGLALVLRTPCTASLRSAPLRHIHGGEGTAEIMAPFLAPHSGGEVPSAARRCGVWCRSLRLSFPSRRNAAMPLQSFPQPTEPMTSALPFDDFRALLAQLAAARRHGSGAGAAILRTDGQAERLARPAGGDRRVARRVDRPRAAGAASRSSRSSPAITASRGTAFRRDRSRRRSAWSSLRLPAARRSTRSASPTISA